MSTQSTSAFEIQNKLAELEQQLLDDSPEMPTLLRTIHKELKADPDVVTILTEEECAILVRGLKKQTKTEIVTAAIKSTSKKSLKNISVNDL